MQSFNFALRQSTADSADDNRSRYVPSSIYSGPGPAEESPLPPQPIYLQNGYHKPHVSNGINGVSNAYRNVHSNSHLLPLQNSQPRDSIPFNSHDPIAMHLLAETALSDSRDFEVLSFEQLEQLKKDRVMLRNRIEATKRKIGLECKLRDAAHSLNRLYLGNKGSIDLNEGNRTGHTRDAGGSKSSNTSALGRANDEYLASNTRIEELTQELKLMESKLENTQKRIMEHTAGILQLTHKGLKKNVRKSEIPKSNGGIGHGQLGNGVLNQVEDFDERSLYPIPDYVHDFIQSNPVTPIPPSSRKFSQDTHLFDEVAGKLQILGTRMHDMIRHLNPMEDIKPPPGAVTTQSNVKSGSEVQLQLDYIAESLNHLNTVQQRTLEESENVNARINHMLEKTNSVSRSPLVGQDGERGEDPASQLAFSSRILEQLNSRIETLIEQKDILTRQIQQQRELNTKSDAQRDAQIRDLAEELEESKRLQAMSEQESQESQNQISLLIEQLDRSRQDVVLMEEQRGMNESKALQAERDARKATEKELLSDIESKQQIHTQLQADMAKIQNDFELRSQQHIQQLNELSTAKEQASIEAKRHQSEAEKLLEQLAALQTELTIVKAELDGAYGTRAQRAADVSLNPAIQKELDLLSSKNAELQKELKDTIEDYEQMTKASIEFEKERDQFESSIDVLRERCESLESQLNEEKLKWLGVKAQAPMETTSTMVLKNEFKKMMRDTRAENSKVLRAEQDERRKLEALIRSMKKEAGLATPAKSIASSHLSAEPTTPSAH